jgi:hypothetical protein
MTTTNYDDNNWPQPRWADDADKQGEPDDETRLKRLKQYVADHPDEADGFDLGEDS